MSQHPVPVCKLSCLAPPSDILYRLFGWLKYYRIPEGGFDLEKCDECGFWAPWGTGYTFSNYAGEPESYMCNDCCKHLEPVAYHYLARLMCY